jgi:hypothetical protein
MDVMMGKLLGSVDVFTQIIDKCFKSNATRPALQRSRIKPLYRPLPVSCDDYSPATETFDSFSAQMNTCRDQEWWESQASLSDTETLYDRPMDCQNGEELPKRSLSIREIRERMDSAHNTANNLDGRLEFEPGLRILDGIRGGWRDMEMFIE